MFKKIIQKVKKILKYQSNLYYAKFSQNKYRFELNKNNLKKRKYPSYNTYKFHQKMKTFFRWERLMSGYEINLKKFEIEFSKFKSTDIKIDNILCVAARLGTEVHALRNLDYNAIGIDIIYPKNSKYVHYGEFEEIPYPNNSFEAIYSNSIDHVYDLKKTLFEFNRIIKSEGYLLLRLMKGFEEGFEMDGAYESFAWAKTDDLLNEIKKHINFELVKTIEIGWNKSLYILKKKS